MAQSLTSSSPSECDELEGVGGQKRSAKDFNINLELTSNRRVKLNTPAVRHPNL